MRYSTITLLIGVLAISSCGKTNEIKPIWANKSDAFFLSSDSLVFETSEGSDWTAVLLTRIQPIEMNVNMHKSGFSVRFHQDAILPKGEALLVVSNCKKDYLYEIFIDDTTQYTSIPVDYRSPKTVNPDSSLEQQSIRWLYNENQNLIYQGPDKTFFMEERLNLSPVSGVFRALENIPLSSYYVQPGSVTEIPIFVELGMDRTDWIATIGPLKDVYNNYIADGTELILNWQNTGKDFDLICTVKDGFVNTKIPVMGEKDICLQAEIHNKKSQRICSAKK